ncbi:MAG: C40 family peptidase, partial [Antricoccus sp.]
QDVAAAKKGLGEVAAKAYTGGNSTAVSTLLTSSSPADLIDKLGTLDQISSYNNAKVITYLSAAKSAAADKSAADSASAAATATENDLASKKTSFETQLPKLKAQLAALTPAQTTAVEATTGGAPVAPTAAAVPAAPVVSAGGGGSGAAQQAVSVAMAQIGKPYVFGAAGPNAFDCSGLTMYAYAAVGISLPHSSDGQSGMGTPVSMSALQPGDLLFASGHVAMYIGGGMVVHAPVPGANVRTMPMQYMSWFGAARFA